MTQSRYFSKWGTHFLVEFWLSVSSICVSKNSCLIRASVKILANKINLIFKNVVLSMKEERNQNGLVR